MALKTYPNGLKLSIVQKKELRLVNVDIHITAGTQSEKNYESGISEFTSRMLLMGTKKHPAAQDLITFAKSNGIVLSSDNTSESIIISAQTVKENVNKAIELLCEIAFDSAFSLKAGDVVRSSMLADLSKLNENPAYILEKMVNQALFYRTGLANPKYGTTTTITRMTSQNSRDFMERVLTPKNTVVSVVGDVNADDIYEKVMQTFYSRFIAGGEYKKLKYVANIENFTGGERTKNKKLNQSRIFLAFPSLSYKSPKKYVIEIVKPIIQKRIKDELGNLNYFHNEEVTSVNFANNGKLTIETMVDYDHAKEYLDRVVEIIKYIAYDGISELEFEIEKNAYIIEFLKKGETAFSLSHQAAREVAINKQTYSEGSEFLKVELLTIADVNKVLSRVLDINKLYIAYLGNPIEINSLDYLD